MKTHTILGRVVLMMFMSSALGFPAGSWTTMMAEIRERAAAPITSAEDSNEMVGDLISPGPTTPVGQV
jgi:hypothetical protein